MPLVLALKNRDSIVVASDASEIGDAVGYGQFMNVPGRAILLMAGNLEAVRKPIEQLVIPKLGGSSGAAVLAQLLQAALVLEVVPHLGDVAGRVEIIVAGIDPVRHTEEPSFYYLDSAQDFYLKAVSDNVLAAGSTAVVGEVLGNRDLATASTEELTEIAKECLATTKMRWPTAVATHQRFGIITPSQIQILDF